MAKIFVEHFPPKVIRDHYPLNICRGRSLRASDTSELGKDTMPQVLRQAHESQCTEKALAALAGSQLEIA